MNALIKQTLDERAADGPAPYVDVAALEAAGRRRVRRRRVASGVSALAVLAVVGVATPYVVNALGDGGDQGQVAVDGAAPTPVSWSTGSTVHLGDEVVELPSAPVAYVLSDDGIVWTDAQDGVNLTAGDRTSQLGVSTPDYGRVLVAEGSYAAWYDGNEQAFTVVDTGTRELVRQVPVTLDGPQDGEFDGPSVRALDDGVLWFYADREVTGVDVASGDVVDSSGARWNEALADVEDGVRALADVDDGPGEDELAEERVTVVAADGEQLRAVRGYSRALLSPGARYVVTDPNDSEQVWDVATGEDVTPDLGYDFMAVSQWLDDDTFQAIGLDILDGPDGEVDSPIDILVCSVSAGTCETRVDDAAEFTDADKFSLPVGESLGD